MDTFKQLSLWTEPEVVYTWNSLDVDEQHFLSYLITKDGAMIPPPYEKTKAAIKRLKAKGLVRDSLLGKEYVEITDLGDTLADDYFAHLHQTGKMWSCKR